MGRHLTHFFCVCGPLEKSNNIHVTYKMYPQLFWLMSTKKYPCLHNFMCNCFHITSFSCSPFSNVLFYSIKMWCYSVKLIAFYYARTIFVIHLNNLVGHMFVWKECTFTHWMLKGNAEASYIIIFKATASIRYDIYLIHIPVSAVIWLYSCFSWYVFISFYNVLHHVYRDSRQCQM